MTLVKSQYESHGDIESHTRQYDRQEVSGQAASKALDDSMYEAKPPLLLLEAV
jgi:hypothetical protein